MTSTCATDEPTIDSSNRARGFMLLSLEAPAEGGHTVDLMKNEMIQLEKVLMGEDPIG